MWRRSSHTAAANQSASPAHDRGHADTRSDPEHAARVCRTGWPVRPPLSQITGTSSGPAEIRTYLLHLTNDRRLAASSIIVTVSALRFFYTVTLKRPWVFEDDIPAGEQAKKLPVVMSQDEVARFLAAVDNLKHRVILTVCYATGLRISEAVCLSPTPSTAGAWSSGSSRVRVAKTAM